MRFVISKCIIPKRILTITFTKAAATEMESRYMASGGEKGVAFSTFHALFFRIIREKFGYSLNMVLSENDKREYDIEKAMNKLSLHVDNFIYHIKRNGLMLSGLNVENPVFNLCFDQELFGHRWFEGIAFLREFLIRSSKDDKIRLTTPSENLKDPSIGYEKLYINESSWGSGGYSDVWLDDTNIWVYRHIHKAIERMEELTQRFPSQGSLKGRFLNQASREVLLAMSSDWPYILHDRTSVTYAEKRIRNHLGSFNVVYSAMCKNTVNTEWLIKAERRNAIFPNIDYNIFNPMK